MGTKKATTVLTLVALLACGGALVAVLVGPRDEDTSVAAKTLRRDDGVDVGAPEPTLTGSAAPSRTAREVTSSDGHPVTVSVSDELGKPRANVSVRVRRLADWWKDASGVRDWPDDGCVTNPSGETVVQVRREQDIVGVYDPADGASKTASCAGDRLRFILPRPGVLRIAVRSRQGEPISGATVVARDGTSSSRWNKGFKERRQTGAKGLAEFLLPSGSRSAWVRAYKAGIGLGNVVLDTASGNRTVVLRGSHDVRFKIRSTRGAERGDVFQARLMVRDGPTPVWEFSRTVGVDEEVFVGRLPDKATVVLLASSPDGNVALDSWQATSGVRVVQAAPGSSLTIRAASEIAPLSRAAVVPPDPFTFDDVVMPKQFGDDGTVVFDALPSIPGKWLFVAWGDQQQPLAADPRTFDFHPVPGEGREVRIRLGEGKGVTIEGTVRAAGTTEPIPYAQIRLANPDGPVARLADDKGRFSLRSRRLAPFRVYVRRDGYFPTRLHVTRQAAEAGPVNLSVTLRREDAEDTHAIAVNVANEQGGKVSGAAIEWFVEGMLVGTPLYSSESASPTRLPRGSATLRVTPPPGGVLKSHADDYSVAKDREFTVVLERVRRTAGVTVRLRTQQPLREQFALQLRGATTHWGTVRSGVGRLENIPEGLYDLEVRIGPATIRLGQVDVVAPATTVDRAFGRVVALTVRPLMNETGGAGPFRALLKSPGDGAVIADSRAAPGEPTTWMVPEGAYSVEVFGAGRYGTRKVKTAGDSAGVSVDVPMSRAAGSATIDVLGSDRQMLGLAMHVTGPTDRKWRCHMRRLDGKLRTRVAGLPHGTYDISVGTEDGRLVGRARFDIRADGAEAAVEVHLRLQ